jgi:hypothetical protein
MNPRSRWNRVDAEHWVHRLLATQTFVLVLVTVWTFAMGLGHGLVLLTVFPATMVALSGWLTAAWRKERPWAWYVAAILFGMRFAGSLSAVLGGTVSWVSVALLVFDGLLLVNLFHPNGRARIERSSARVQGADADPRAWVEPRS